MYGRNLDLDCAMHGTGSAWWNAPEQKRARQVESDRLRVLQFLSHARRKYPDALPLRVLMCGSRHFADKVRVDAVVRTISEMLHHDASRHRVVLIAGGAQGADALAAAAGRRAGIEVNEFPADWQRHGRAAGPIRNQQMLDEGKPHLVIAFDASGRGTTDMVRRAKTAGVFVCVLDADSTVTA